MKEELNRILLALIAQVATDGATPSADAGPNLNGAGQEARDEALQCLLFDLHSGASAADFSVRGTIQTSLKACLPLLPGRVETAVELYAASDRVSGNRDALHGLVTLVTAQALHSLGAGAGHLRFQLERVEGEQLAGECPDLGAGLHARLRVEARPSTAAATTQHTPLDSLFRVPRGAGDSWNLGLSLARKAAWSLGGLVCEGSPGDGTVCTVYLPLVATLQPRARASVAGTRNGCGSRLGLGVLYVSSEEAILSMGRSSLIESDCCVRVASSGREALHGFEARAEEIDLVVIEDDLEDMTGEALAGELRRRTADLPVLIAARAGRREQLRDYILTPFSAGQLRSAALRATAPGLRPQVGLA